MLTRQTRQTNAQNYKSWTTLICLLW